MSEKQTHRTITMSDAPPVRVKVADWPVIAKADEDSWVGRDSARWQQASAQGELDDYTLRVRKHADGRVLIYGILDAASAWTGSESRQAGVLLPAGSDEQIPAAIRQVGEDCNIPDSVIRACVANLPAIEI